MEISSTVFETSTCEMFNIRWKETNFITAMVVQRFDISKLERSMNFLLNTHV